MKPILLMMVCFACVIQTNAQDIADARQQALNSEVTVSGIVTNGDELGAQLDTLKTKPPE